MICWDELGWLCCRCAPDPFLVTQCHFTALSLVACTAGHSLMLLCRRSHNQGDMCYWSIIGRLEGCKGGGPRLRLHVMLCIVTHTARGHRAAYNSQLRKTGLNNHSRPIARHGHPSLLLAQEMEQGERWGRGECRKEK